MMAASYYPKGFFLMANNILMFLAFSLSAIILCCSIPQRLRKSLLLALNTVFYLCISTYGGGGPFLAEIVLSYCLLKILERYRNKFTLSLCIIPPVLALILTKYHSFIPRSLFTADTVRLIIPAGISFYTLRIVSCAYDVYAGKIERVPSFCDYALYISLFTQILSGPVMRLKDFAAQIDSLHFDSEGTRYGAFMILCGLLKKLVVANMASSYVASVHANIAGVNAIALWLGAFLYAVEIYADFSGYSDISNGLMRIMGIRVADNFYAPYFSRGFGDFWRRWHISFSSWLRDYVYIPLGGSRCSASRHFVNLMITFLVSGLWHGAGMNFALWGILHGLLSYLSPRVKALRNPLITFILVMLLWIPFRSENISASILYFTRMFSDVHISASSIISAILIFTGDNTCVLYASVLFAGITVMFLHDTAMVSGKNYSFAFTMIFTVMIILFGRIGESAFIYSQF